jgi:hypothetical protein
VARIDREVSGHENGMDGIHPDVPQNDRCRIGGQTSGVRARCASLPQVVPRPVVAIERRSPVRLHAGGYIE